LLLGQVVEVAADRGRGDAQLDGDLVDVELATLGEQLEQAGQPGVLVRHGADSRASRAAPARPARMPCAARASAGVGCTQTRSASSAASGVSRKSPLCASPPPITIRSGAISEVSTTSP